MLTAALAALLLLILLAAAVTVTDAVRAAHWRRVADDRRWSWHEQAHGGPSDSSGSASAHQVQSARPVSTR